MGTHFENFYPPAGTAGMYVVPLDLPHAWPNLSETFRSCWGMVESDLGQKNVHFKFFFLVLASKLYLCMQEDFLH